MLLGSLITKTCSVKHYQWPIHHQDDQTGCMQRAGSMWLHLKQLKMAEARVSVLAWLSKCSASPNKLKDHSLTWRDLPPAAKVLVRNYINSFCKQLYLSYYKSTKVQLRRWCLNNMHFKSLWMHLRFKRNVVKFCLLSCLWHYMF